MYSIVLFIVDTSLSGFFGSGDRPTSAVDMIRADQLVGHPAGELDVPGQASSSRSATSSSKQSPEPISVNAMSSRPQLVHDDVGGPQDDVDTVLRAHHAEVGDQEAAAPAQFRVAGPRRSRSGSGPVRTTVTSAGGLAAPRAWRSRR